MIILKDGDRDGEKDHLNYRKQVPNFRIHNMFMRFMYQSTHNTTQTNEFSTVHNILNL